MFKHVVCISFKADSKDKVVESKEKIEALVKKIDVLKKMQVGIDELKSDVSYDFVIIADFDSRSDYETYETHPEHLKVVDFIKDHIDKIVSVDYTYLDRTSI